MFPFASASKKARQQAREWVSLARKVDHFRRDVLPPNDLEELRERRERLETALRRQPLEASALKEPIETLEKTLKRCGGSFYPRSFWIENIEMILVAAILAIGVRTFFLQPFKIPTNSMYPSYNGLTTEVYFADEDPNKLVELLNLVRLGATHREIEGEPGAELILPIDAPSTLREQGVSNPRGDFQGDLRGAFLSERYVEGRRWFIFPSTQAQYRFVVGDEVVAVNVPLDFPMGDVVEAIIERAGDNLRIERGSGDFDFLARTGLRANEDGEVLSFDVKTGDMLFVDRFSYNFVRPDVGDPFVFRTDEITGMTPGERGKYYIKRVVGTPGDTLEIDPPQLLRNGEPITGAPAFAGNAAQEGEYPGYQTVDPGYFFPGDRPLRIPEESYFAMGDNSPHSADSRMWGFVPEDSIVGKAVFIYYPFSFRWGLAE